MHRLFLDSKSAVNELKQSMNQSMSEMGFDIHTLKKAHEGVDDDKNKMNIPLHENLPKDAYKPKEAP
jgi:hypothetical protein